jgi:GT2 family glycosyltransferase
MEVRKSYIRYMSLPRIHIGIVTYNSIKDIARCLQSVESQDYAGHWELTILDSASKDGTQDWLQANATGHRLLLSQVNLGFGNAHNQILQVSTEYDYYLCLNPDMELDPSYLRQAVQVFQESADQVGAVNGLICYLDENGQKTDVVFTRGHAFCQERRTESLDIGRRVHEVPHGRQEIFCPNGCAPLFKAEMIQDVALPGGALFEPKFFMYSEDEDLGWRMRLLGWQTIYDSEVLGWHRAGGSNPTANPVVRIDSLSNRYCTILRNDDLGLFLGSLPIILFVESLFVAVNGLRRPRFFGDYFRAVLRFLKMSPYFWQSRKHLKIRISRKERRAMLQPFDLHRFKLLFKRHARRSNRHSIHSRD